MSEFKNLPSGWKVVRLGEIAKKSILKNRSSLIKLVLSNSAINGLVAQNEYFDKDIANKENIQDYYVVDIGDFVYNPRISQNAPTGPINRNMLSKGIVSPLYTVFSVQDETLAKFLAYFFKTIIWQNEIKSVANYGARHDRINITDNAFFSLKISLPPLDEQEKIAEILSTWDEAINLTINLIESKKQFKKALMQNLLTAKVRFPEFQDGWEDEKLNNLTFFQEGPGVRNTQYKKEGVKLLNVGNLNNNTLNLNTTTTYISETEAYGAYKHFLVDDGDLLISCSGISSASFKNKIAFAEKKDLPLCLNTSTMRFKSLDGRLSLKYLYYFFQTIYFETQVLGILTGSAQFNFGPTHIKWFKIKLPNLNEQQKIAEVLTACDDEINLLNLKLENLKKQKQGLMQKLLSAKVRVK